MTVGAVFVWATLSCWLVAFAHTLDGRPRFGALWFVIGCMYGCVVFLVAS